MTTTAWINRRQRAFHLTLRHSDVPDFDVPALLDHLEAAHVTLFSVFIAGYVTLYPTALPFQRQAPGLNGRDLAKELLEGARARGMVVFPSIDLGEIPLDLAQADPEAVAVQKDGSFFTKTDGIVSGCSLGRYVRTYGPQVIREVTSRYTVDGLKFGGASYSGPPGVCHCAACIAAYPGPLPASAKDPAYAAWRQRLKAETVVWLQQQVQDIAGLPSMGNNIWSIGHGGRIDDLVASQDLSQIETQSRTHAMPDAAGACWERFTLPTETARFADGLAPHPVLLPTSYFLAWPWRRVAVPWLEQKLFLAQGVANGASPMINYSGGHPATVEDPRGHRAYEELFALMAERAAWIDGDTSAAHIALLIDYPSAARVAHLGDAYERFNAELAATQDILDRGHLPYDIIATDALHRLDPARHRVAVLIAAEALDPALATDLAARIDAGLGLVVTDAPGLAHGSLPPLAQRCGVTAIGPAQEFTQPVHIGMNQAYATVQDRTHPITAGIGAPLLAVAGRFHPVTTAPGASAPLVRGPCFRVFPEGISSPDRPDPGEPLAVCQDGPGGRTVFFPFELGRVWNRSGHSDAERLLTEAVAWAARGTGPVGLPGFPDVLMSVRRLPGALVVHLINATGRRRHLEWCTPVHDLVLHLGVPVVRATSAVLGDLPVGPRLTVPTLTDYDLIRLELA